MGSWNGDNYESIPRPDNPAEANKVQRRAMMYRRIKDLGHPALFDADEKRRFARKFDISYRQVHYDLEAVREFVAETLDLEKHLSNVQFVFEKAMSEAIQDGNWQEAADIATQQAEWLEHRGIIDNEDVDQLEISPSDDWRQFIEQGEDESELEDPVDVEGGTVEGE